MAVRPRINLKLLQQKLLCFLHYQYAKAENVSFTAKELVDLIPGYSSVIIGTALDALEEQDLAISENVAVPDEGDAESFWISLKGIGIVEEWPEDLYQEVSEGINFENEDIEKTPEASRTSSAFIEKNIPSSDRYVSRSDNQETWSEAVTALDKFVVEFRKDHPIDNQLGAEKPAILGALEVGRRLLDDAFVSTQLGAALLIEPLRKFVSKHKEAVGAAVATKVIDGIVMLANTALAALTRLFN